MGVIHPTIMK